MHLKKNFLKKFFKTQNFRKMLAVFLSSDQFWLLTSHCVSFAILKRLKVHCGLKVAYLFTIITATKNIKRPSSSELQKTKHVNLHIIWIVIFLKNFPQYCRCLRIFTFNIEKNIKRKYPKSRNKFSKTTKFSNSKLIFHHCCPYRCRWNFVK